jgi:hypothetical protein
LVDSEIKVRQGQAQKRFKLSTGPTNFQYHPELRKFNAYLFWNHEDRLLELDLVELPGDEVGVDSGDERVPDTPEAQNVTNPLKIV